MPAYNFIGINNVADPAQLKEVYDRGTRVTSLECQDIINADVTNKNGLRRRQGYTLHTGGNVTAAWGNSRCAYCVIGGTLHSFSSGGIEPLVHPTSLGTTEFAAVNDVVVYSDATTLGVIDLSGVVTEITKPEDWVSVETLETWVKDHYPSKLDAQEVIETNAFKLPTIAGRRLCFYNGTLYLAVNNFVYRSDAFNVAKMDIRYNVVGGFPHDVTMLKAVANGIYVGTKEGCYFLPGGGATFDTETGNMAKSFNCVRVSNSPVISNSGINGIYKDKAVVIWVGRDQGIFVGGESGEVILITEDTLALPPVEVQTVWFKPGEEGNKYVVVYPSGDAWVINLSNLGVSRYDNFNFNSLFMFDYNYYAANSSGIFELSGDTDNGQDISAQVVLPALSFGTGQSKILKEVFVSMRGASNITFSLSLDETEIPEEYPLLQSNTTGVHTRRAKLARGLKGTYWGLSFRNLDGADFDLLSLVAKPVALGRIH